MKPNLKRFLPRMLSSKLPRIGRVNSLSTKRSNLVVERLEDRWVPAFVLRLEQVGFAPLTIIDEGPGDGLIGPDQIGNIRYAAPYGKFDIDITIVDTKPDLGGPNFASLAQSQTNINFSSSAGGTLLITVGDTDYVDPGVGNNPLTLTSVIGGTLPSNGGGSVKFQSWANADNLNPFSATTVIPAGSVTPGPIGPFTISPFSGSASTTFIRGSGPYSLFQQATIVMNGAGNLGFNARTDVTGSPTPPPAPASLGDFVFEDKNANGIQDAGEPGIPDVLVTLLDANGNSVGTTKTDSNGKYLFGNLTPGKYAVSFPTIPDYVRTFANVGDDKTDSDAGADGKTGFYTLASGESNLTVDAGYYRPASIGDFVFEDTNANGQQDLGEPGISGVTVSLTGTDGANNPVNLTTTTGVDGSYKFANLVPGTYQVTFGGKAGFVPTVANVGDDTTDSDADVGTGKTGNYTLISGEYNKTVDAGYYRPVSVGDFVWYDQNLNGIQDTGEPGIANVVLSLTGTSGSGKTVLLTTQTDNDGKYSFANLEPGTYQVAVTPPAGYFATVTGKGKIETDSNTSPASTTPGFLPSGASDQTLDFGFYKLAKLGDFVWEDLNANGQQDANEPGIDGVTVTLTGTDFTGQLVSKTTTTNSLGKYLFDNLVPGQYVVTFPTLTGYVRTVANVGNDETDSDASLTDGKTGTYTLLSEDFNKTVDAGYYRPASIGDFVFEDKNANGVQDAGEAGIANVLVTLTGTDGAGNAVSLTTTTGSDGKYKFENLVPGQYVVTFPTLTGYVRTVANVGDDAKDSDAGADGKTGTYTLVSGQYNDTVDAGYYKLASLGDFVWEDLNANGQQDLGEPGISGVTVSLTGTDGAGKAVSLTTTTNSLGKYLFENLVPGSYVVTFPALTGYVRTVANVGNDMTDSDASLTDGMTGTYILASGESNLTVDAGYYKLASLGDFVWEDLNANGQQDLGEPGISGVTVSLTGTDGANNPVNLTTTTGADGSYKFANLVPGTYQVTFGGKAGFVPTVANVGDDTTDSDADVGTGKTGNYTLISGEYNKTVDAGYYRPVSVGDFVWYDQNLNGIQDTGEPGIANVVLSLTGTSGSGKTVSLTTQTDNDGKYSFVNLEPGTYQVAVTPPAGFLATVTGKGKINAPLETDSNTSPASTTPGFLPSGASDQTLDFGFYKLAKLGDFVFEDKNANGLQDAGELGIANVTVTLTGTDGFGNAVSKTTTTNSLGKYLFDNLVPGSYVVTFPTLTGYVRTVADAGNNDAIDSDASVTDGKTGTYTIVSEQFNDTVDAGYYKLASLGDFVFEDLNANGQQDLGEPGISGVLVTLTGTDGTGKAVSLTTTTNSQGKYLFENLVPGSYVVTFPALNGFFRTVANVGNDMTDSDASVVNGQTGTYTLISGETNLTVDAGYVRKAPAIDIEKTTNGSPNANPITPDFDNEDSPNGLGVPVLTPGTTVTWTYKVTNTGNVPFLLSEVVVIDDNGTPSITADDITPTLVTASDVGADGILSPGESWTYTATGIVKNLNTPSGTPTTLDFSGNSPLSGTAGNTRTFSAGSGSTAVSVKASAFSRDKSTGAWATAYLGSYGGGLGVTDTSEGNGSNNTHTVDNIGRDNYVLFRFDQVIVPDAAFLGYVVNDSDLTVWIGTLPDAFNTNIVLSDAVLASLGFTEVNNTTLTTTRTADFNAGNVAGNVVVIAASTSDSTPDDRFKIEKLTVRKPVSGVYANKGTVTLNGFPGVTDSDLSHYKNPTDQARVQLKKFVSEVISTGGEGLTPGFWKQSQHFYAWVGYTQNQSYNTVFGVNDDPSLTLLGALQRGGGGKNALGRHAVAALLNASNDNVSYLFTPSQIIAAVQAAYASNNFESTKNQFANQNELGADLTTGGGNSANGPLNDANTAPGLIVLAGSQITFTYKVSNPGQVGLTNVVVRDDNATPNNTSDDFNATPVLSGGFNIGDVNKNNVLDVGETWEFVSGVFTVLAGQFTNLGTVTATAVNTTNTVTDDDPANWFGVTNDETSIRGKKFKDVSGNGLNLVTGPNSPADVPLAGVKIYLDANNNSMLDSGEAWTTTAADGSYEFRNLTPGDYIIREVVPTNFVRTTPVLQDFYAVSVVSGQIAEGFNFANYEKCEPDTISNIYFKIYNANGTFRAQVTDLRGNVNPGDRVKAFFTINAGKSEVVTLVSYTAPESFFNANTASQQTIYDLDSAEFGPGDYVLEVLVPNSNFQIDFVCGPAIDKLGPAGSNIFYTPQMRLISADNDGNGAPTGVSSLSGFVYVDANNNGIKEASESGIAGVTIRITGTDYLGNPVDRTTTTSSTGAYSFTNLKMSDRNGYRITETQPANFLDGKDTLGSLGGIVMNDSFDEILLGVQVDGTGYNFGERLNAASVGSLSGFVYVDVDNDGLREINESGIIDVQVKLFVKNGSNWVFVTETTTDEDGYYVFTNLPAGTYRIEETQPYGFLDGKEKAGSLGGNIAVDDKISEIALAGGQAGVNYNFGELGVGLRDGMTATIGFWKNKNGQKIIENAGITSNGLSLANWLAQNFPNLYGSLAGKSNSFVADYFIDLFKGKDTKVEAQVMATALAVFVTDTRLNTSSYGQSLAVKYGFRLSSPGTGAALYNVGDNGESFELDDNAWTTVFELLKRADNKASNGHLYMSVEGQFNNVFTRINEIGDIK